jgi:hypothetical protein
LDIQGVEGHGDSTLREINLILFANLEDDYRKSRFDAFGG